MGMAYLRAARKAVVYAPIGPGLEVGDDGF
jgi:hypothetical protein